MFDLGSPDDGPQHPAYVQQIDRIASEIAERDALAVPSNFRHGMGIFSQDTLDADASLEGARREAEQLRDQERRLAENARALELHMKRLRRWAWLPWSKYRRHQAEFFGFQLAEARRETQRERERAMKYKDAALSGKKPTEGDIFNIDHGIPDNGTDMLKSTDPTPDDDPNDLVIDFDELPQTWKWRPGP